MPDELVDTGELQPQNEPPVDSEDLLGESLTSESESGTEEGEPKKEEPWFKKRISEITRQKYEKAQEAEYWKGQAEALKAAKAETKPETKPVESVADLGARPREDDFDDYNKYLEARDEYNRKIIKFETMAEFEARESARRTEEAKATKTREFQDWSIKGVEAFPDFQDVALKPPMQGGAPYTPEMYEAVLAADNSHRIAYYLGKHPDVAQKLCTMPPAKAAMEIGKLDIKLTPSQTKKISDAPVPIKPLESVSAKTSDLYDPKLSMEDFAKRWKTERQRK